MNKRKIETHVVSNNDPNESNEVAALSAITGYAEVAFRNP